MNLPTWVYKYGKPDPKNGRLVNNVKEMLLALEDGYWSHRYNKEDIIDLPIVKEAQRNHEQEQKDDAVFTRFTEVKKPVEKPSEEVSEDLKEKYKEETGKDAIWESGPRKGKPTKEFKEWSIENADK